MAGKALSLSLRLSFWSIPMITCGWAMDGGTVFFRYMNSSILRSSTSHALLFLSDDVVHVGMSSYEDFTLI
jgi:hypothetical protein